MKILFLAGSFEPGKDGVGDYTRTLATECARLGHETFLVGLNDPWIDAPVQDRQLLRLEARASWPDRVRAAQPFLTENRPDMVSLQFVPYSFSSGWFELRVISTVRVNYSPNARSDDVS